MGASFSLGCPGALSTDVDCTTIEEAATRSQTSDVRQTREGDMWEAVLDVVGAWGGHSDRRAKAYKNCDTREGVKTVARQSLGTWKRVEKKGSNNAERNEGIALRVDVTVEVRG